jgi:peroxiredoxin
MHRRTSNSALVSGALVIVIGSVLSVAEANAFASIPAAAQPEPARERAGPDFQRIVRPGSVNIESEFDLSNLSIPKEEIHTLVPRDAIPALTDPRLERISSAEAWLPDEARIVSVSLRGGGGQTVGVPLNILNWHEVVNLTIGGEPMAVTYCPLCDSAVLISRRVRTKDGRTEVLEFGVSGALYNSNVLMYDKQHKGLWSQLAMEAVSGPLAGTALDVLLLEIMSFRAFKEEHPRARILSRETGHRRDYTRSAYEQYMTTPGLMVPVAQMGEALPPKTLGLGIAVGDASWFIPVDVIGESFTLATPAGPVRAAATPAGVRIHEAPDAARTAQSFYYSWSAFFPETIIVKQDKQQEQVAPTVPGLPIGAKAPDAELMTPAGEIVRLSSLMGEQPVIIVFYRGGWCPICTRTLAAWQDKIGDMQAAGARLIAITPENPSHAGETITNWSLDFTVLSDPQHDAARAFNVLFTVDPKTRDKYREMLDLELEEWNASGTWELPAPATLIIDRDGIIRYIHADWDYRQRADPDEVLAALNALKQAPK